MSRLGLVAENGGDPVVIGPDARDLQLRVIELLDRIPQPGGRVDDLGVDAVGVLELQPFGTVVEARQYVAEGDGTAVRSSPVDSPSRSPPREAATHGRRRRSPRRRRHPSSRTSAPAHAGKQAGAAQRGPEARSRGRRPRSVEGCCCCQSRRFSARRARSPTPIWSHHEFGCAASTQVRAGVAVRSDARPMMPASSSSSICCAS